MQHDLGKGWVAKKVDNLFEVYHNEVFKFSTARLKFAKMYAK